MTPEQYQLDDRLKRLRHAEALANEVLELNDLSCAANFLRVADIRSAVAFLTRLMRECHIDQAPTIAYLVDEFLPASPFFVYTRFLEMKEEAMFGRLGSVWGIKRCLVREAARTPEGRKTLKTQLLS